MNRDELIEKALSVNAQKVMVIDRWQEGIGRINFFEIQFNNLVGVFSTIFVQGAKFRRDFEEEAPRGRRIKSIVVAASVKEDLEINKLEGMFVKFFNIPLMSIEEAINAKNDATIQFLRDNANRLTIKFMLLPELKEVGPRLYISYM